jgi:hypothetical protein
LNLCTLLPCNRTRALYLPALLYKPITLSWIDFRLFTIRRCATSNCWRHMLYERHSTASYSVSQKSVTIQLNWIGCRVCLVWLTPRSPRRVVTPINCQSVTYLRKRATDAGNTVTSDTFRCMTAGCVRLHLCLDHKEGSL